VAGIKLSDDEVQALLIALATFAIRARTGELGIVHGANRFVSTDSCLRKSDKEALNSAALKMGLSKGIPEVQ
jgi:hypothetical protein